MIVLLGFAFLSGVITILSPCILPVLPVVLAGGATGGKARPLGVMAGFVASFAGFTLALTAIVQAFRIPADAMRIVAVVLVGAFGLVMLVPPLRHRFEAIASRIASFVPRRAPKPGAAPAGSPPRAAGFAGGVVVGLSLGLVWTPCVGPIMASVTSLALTRRVDGGAVFIALAYALGTSLPMLGVMLGGRALLARVPVFARNGARIQQGFGVLMLAVAVAVGLGWDRRFQAAVLELFPGYGAGLTALERAKPVQRELDARQPVPAMAMQALAGSGAFQAPREAPEHAELGDYGAAPEFLPDGSWYNTEGVVAASGPAGSGASRPLSLAALRGRVVVVDFWTYSCVNCIRTLPYLRAWFEAYRDAGLVVVGVHTPEFEFEKKPANVARAIRELGVTWPVVQDNDYVLWSRYGNRYWPAHYFIDANGHVRYFHFGEGDYDVGERVIKKLLAEVGAATGSIVSRPAPVVAARTPETYLGYDRASGFASAVPVAEDAPVEYRPAGRPANAEWSLAGTWTITREYVVPRASGSLELGFDARNVFLVVEPEEPGGTISVLVDGAPAGDTPDVRRGALAVTESRMYQLVALPAAGPHVLRLEVTGRLRLYAFTFG